MTDDEKLRPPWNEVREKLDEHELPEHYRRVFQAFDQQFDDRLEERPRFIEQPGESGTGAGDLLFLPDYDDILPKSTLNVIGWSVLPIGCLGSLVVLIIGLVIGFAVAIEAFPYVLGIGCSLVALVAVKFFVEAWRKNQRRRKGPRQLFGAFADKHALVMRQDGRCHYYPRRALEQIAVENPTGTGAGGGRVSNGYWPYIIYRDREGQHQKTALGMGGGAHFEPPTQIARRLNEWLRTGK